eukprot:gene4391-4644_t
MEGPKGKLVFDECRTRCRGQLVDTADQAIHIHPVPAAALDTFLQSFDHPLASGWAKITKFKAKSGDVLLLPDNVGGLSCVLLGVGSSASDAWAYAALPGKLPPGNYALDFNMLEVSWSAAADSALLGWMLGCYEYSRYKTGVFDKNKGDLSSNSTAAAEAAEIIAGNDARPLLLIPPQADQAAVYPLAEAFFWCRDLINTPAEDLGPQQLAAEARAMASSHPGATVLLTEGDDLLKANYPAVHTTGQGMKLMKKDMGGAALVLALSHVIMSAGLPVRLRVLVPAVENAISGSAYRPGDVLQTRAGITVENNNTDAEGRLILCDAVFEAASSKPDLLIDAATLTGAARVALGPELPAVFTNCDDTWRRLESAAQQEFDPMWRLPLWTGYRKQLESKVADLTNVGGEAGQAGAITAALFLQEFAQAAPAWVHIDTAGWVSGCSVGPGRPEGGEALGLRTLWRFLQDKFAVA